MVESWIIGFQKDISHFYFIFGPVSYGIINPTLHYPRTQYSTIPVFHHSNCERSEPNSYFLPPRAIPRWKYFWLIKTNAMTGTVISTAAADMGPKSSASSTRKL
jgi:hypothetical protein